MVLYVRLRDGGGQAEIVWSEGGGRHQRLWRLTGDARTLEVGVYVGKVPFGILLDRLQEHPEEVEGCPAELVQEAVEWLRNSK